VVERGSLENCWRRKALVGSNPTPSASSCPAYPWPVLDGVVIDRRYRGFEQVAQGGYTSGVLAGSLEGPAQVRLRGAVPMDVPLRVERQGDGVVLCGESGVLAEASAAELELELPERVTPAEAEEGSHGYPGHRSHPFPECFCCGPDRAAGDGLRIFPGPLGEGDLIAAPWTPDASFADKGGFVRPEIVWAAFDCPQLWALMISAPAESTDHVVTGALETEVKMPVRVGEAYAVIAWPLGREGRRLYAGAALLDSAGETLAVSRQTAVIAPRGVPLGLSGA
jgi:hypothetical protein